MAGRKPSKGARGAARRGDIVLVEWEDAYAHEHDQPYQPCTSLTVGYLVDQDAAHVKVAQNYQRATYDEFFPRHMMVIPTAYIRKVEVVKKQAMVFGP